MYFKYCPKCKAELPKARVRGRLLNCKKCDFIFYLAPSVAVEIVLVNEQGECLFTKRAFAPKKGYWDFPGGFVEFGESAEQAAHREIKEELGIKLGALRYLASYSDRYCYKGFNYYTLIIVFYSFTKINKFYPEDDVSEAVFCAPNKLPATMHYSPRIARVLQDYKKLRQKE